MSDSDNDSKTLTLEQAVEKLRSTKMGELIDDIESEGEGLICTTFTHNEKPYTVLIGNGEAAYGLYMYKEKVSEMVEKMQEKIAESF